MTRRAFFLNGLAILAVVCNHATSWGITAMFWWTDRYLPVTVPNFDQIGTLPYYALLVVRKLTIFSVPAFLFVSGFFVAYASRGSQSALSWKMVRTRIWDLLVPYVIWSGVIFISDALQGVTYTPIEYLVRLIASGASGGYYFVPLICQLYLLSPLMAPIARTRARWLLFGSALLQLAAISMLYPIFWRVQAPVLNVIVNCMTPQWLPFKWAFFFALGIVSGFHLQEFKAQLDRYKKGLLVAVVVLGALAILESEMVFRSTGRDWPGSPSTILSSLYVVAFILCFLAFDNIAIPFSKTLNQIASKTYGIYLLHSQAMELIARVIRQIVPWMLAHQLLLFQPVVFIFGVGTPLLFMASVARSPVRKSYRYLFG